ncbi:MAG: DUF1016 N-terminal domain-containing protein [Clostridium sp.]|jgi:hypothetical protein|nr:DUF1016 N-terminal domain-containing protein [Clostridium sp.]
MELTTGVQLLFEDIASLIENSRRAIYAQANYATVLLFWQIGKRINADVLKNEHTEYGKQIIVSLSRQLEERYGRSF